MTGSLVQKVSSSLIRVIQRNIISDKAVLVTWAVTYTLLTAVQHLIVENMYWVMTHVLNGGILLVALLDLNRRSIRTAKIVGFVVLVFCVDWASKSTMANSDVISALFMTTTLVVQATLGLILLRRAGLADGILETQRSVLLFVLWGALIPALVSSTLLVNANNYYLLSYDSRVLSFEFIWWFISRFTALVLVAPVLLLGLNQYFISDRPYFTFFTLEFWLLTLGTVIWAYVLFSVANPPGRALATYGYMLIPAMVLIAIRLPLFQSLLIVLLVSLVCYWVDADSTVALDQSRRSFIALSVFLIINTGIVWLVGVLIQDRQRSFEKERRMKALYEMLSRVNQASLKYNLDSKQLFSQVCEIVYEEGNFQHVCILDNVAAMSLADLSSICIAEYGESANVIKSFNSGCKVLHDSVIEGYQVYSSSCVSCSVSSDCSFKNDIDEGFLSIPIHGTEGVVATLVVFASNADQFDEDIRRLFLEMTEDIGFALKMQGQREQLSQIAEVFHHSQEAIIIADKQGAILNVNPAFTRITGYTRQEVMGSNPRILQSGLQNKDFYKALFEQLLVEGYWSGQFWNKRKSGETYLQRGTISVAVDDRGKPAHFISIMEDVSAQVEAEEKIHSLAKYDQLTGLPNRSMLSEMFESALSQSRRHGVDWSLLFIDLDDFKQVNDALGHHVGDELLREVSQRLSNQIRDTDTLSRFGGDEFILLLQGGAKEAADISSRLINVVSQSYDIHGSTLQISASIGIAMLSHDGETLHDLIQAADTAMYQAKSEGRSCFRFFAASMQSKAQKRLALKQAIKNALTENEFSLVFQPKVTYVHESKSNVIGYEALVRWNRPGVGMVSPGEFIPAAEESGQISDIDRWVLLNVVKQLSVWLGSDRNNVLPIAINVSASLFSKVGFSGELNALLITWGVPANYIELEITEHVATQDMDKTLATLAELKRIGIGLAIDDFGTGYSSLAYLQQFPVDHLKIDISFVRNVHLNTKKQGLVKAIIAMAHSLGMKTIAEGVENEEELHFLNDSGCDEYQGYYFGKPTSGDNIK